ncbi:MAG: TolC family protein [Spirochaetes bacterium]|nr:TolC family protein [Spirochaetota bacterium]
MKKLLLICIIALAAANLPALDKSIDLTLEEYVRLVGRNSKHLRIAAKDLEIAAATERAARSQALPMIGAEAGYTRNLLDITRPMAVAAPPAGGALIFQDIRVNTDNEFSFGLALNQQIFNLRVVNAIRASRQFRLMSGYIFDAQKQAIITIAKKLYYQNYLLEQLLEVRRNLENNSYENYLNAQNKFDAGVISEFDFLRAKVEWKTRIPETLQAQRNLDLARINLKNLAGIPEGTKITLNTNISEFPDIPELMSMSEIFANRPDHKASVAEVSLRRMNLNAARSDHFPTLRGNALFAVSAASNDFSIDDSTRIAQLGLTVSVPIFTGGALSAQTRRAKHEYEQSVIRLHQLREDVAASINSIFLTLIETRQRITAAEATLQTARRAFEIAQTSYRAGVITHLDLKDVTTSYELANLNYISSVYEYLAAYFSWQQAIGEALIR